MNQQDYILNIIDTLKTLDEALHWLNRSYNICKNIGVKEHYSEEEFDSLETLTSRFARVSDIVVQKVFRSIDKAEFEDSGTMIDVINRAHKRGLFDTIDEIRMVRDLRNNIVHEYEKNNLIEIFKDTLHFTPILLKSVERIKAYCSKYTVKDDKEKDQPIADNAEGQGKITVE